VLGDVYRVASPPATGTTHTSLCVVLGSRTVVTVECDELHRERTAGPLIVVTLYQSGRRERPASHHRRAPWARDLSGLHGKTASGTHRSADCGRNGRVDAGSRLLHARVSHWRVGMLQIRIDAWIRSACRFFTRSYRRHRFEDGSRGFPFSVPVGRALVVSGIPTAGHVFSSARTGPESPRCSRPSPLRLGTDCRERGRAR
jgi:hypothetical protein